MRHLIRGSVFIFCLCVIVPVPAQDTLSSRLSNTQLTGYLRSICLSQYITGEPTWYSSGGLHLRMNITHRSSQHLLFRADLRSLFLYGSAIPQQPLIKNSFRQEGELWNMHAIWWKNRNSFGYSNVERLSAHYERRRVSIVFGRQRIHWGMASSWNPNDVFQAGNLFDPDYVERSGADGIVMRRSIGALSGWDVALSKTAAGTFRGAGRYYFNRAGYDMQFLGGWYERQPMFGLGWSGSIANWSFRSEHQIYIPHATESFQLQSVCEFDRILPADRFFKFAFLYNHRGLTGGKSTLFSFIPQASHLMPGKWNGVIGWSCAPSLRFQYGIDLFYTGAAHTFILFPKLEWTFSNDWSASFFLQSAAITSLGRFSHQALFRVGKTFVD
jgi:hypothetical protein